MNKTGNEQNRSNGKSRNVSTRLSQKAAAWLANSFLLRKGGLIYAENLRNWNLPLSKLQKLQTGTWLILNDYHKGIFPPAFPDRQKAYQAEIDYRFTLQGVTPAGVTHANMAKPFWFGKAGRTYLDQFNRLTDSLEKRNIKPPAKILEVGCGHGWIAEFLAAMGFEVCATSISQHDINDARARVKSLEIKNLTPALQFVVTPMESVHQAVPTGIYDAAFVYEALHHAFDWREAVRSIHACLRPGGWFLLCNEPNVLHTCISYRVSQLSKTHEIGFSKHELVAELRQAGFHKVVDVSPRLHFWFRSHWLLAQK